MKKSLFVLAAVVGACQSFHATADLVSPAAAPAPVVPALTALAPAIDAGPVPRAMATSDTDLPLTIVSDGTGHEDQAERASDSRFNALTGFMQAADQAMPEQSSSAQAIALSEGAHWGFLLIGFSALYMLTTRRNRPSHSIH